MFRKEKQIAHWQEHDESGHKQRVIAQENLLRIAPELFEGVVFVNFVPEEDEVA